MPAGTVKDLTGLKRVLDWVLIRERLSQGTLNRETLD
jgi:hypothetical protein